eukprot:gene3126-6147_t
MGGKYNGPKELGYVTKWQQIDFRTMEMTNKFMTSNPETFIISNDEISKTHIDAAYSPYEKCLLSLSTINPNSTYSTQGACLKGFDSSTSHQNYIPPTRYGNSKGILPSIFTTCSLGFGLDNKGDLSGKSHAKMAGGGGLCSVRSIRERKSLKSMWKSNYPLKSIEYLPELFKVLKRKNIHNLILFGDSITRQIVRFLSCDLMRTSNVTVLRNSSLFYTTREGEGNFSEFQYNGHFLRVILGENSDECLSKLENQHANSTSTSFKSKKSLYKTMKYSFYCVTAGSTITNPSVLIFNAGLHLYAGNKFFKLYIYPIIKAFITFAKESQGRVYVLFRETSAQHFTARIGGCFDAKTSLSYKPGDLCCTQSSDLSIAYAGDWRNKIFRETFYKEDPQWESYIGWIPFFNTSLALYDMHMEVNNNMDSDCTHFIYAPFIFSPLWMDTISVLNRMLNVNNAPIRDLSYISQPYRNQRVLSTILTLRVRKDKNAHGLEHNSISVVCFTLILSLDDLYFIDRWVKYDLRLNTEGRVIPTLRGGRLGHLLASPRPYEHSRVQPVPWSGPTVGAETLVSSVLAVSFSLFLCLILQLLLIPTKCNALFNTYKMYRHFPSWTSLCPNFLGVIYFSPVFHNRSSCFLVALLV